MNVWDIIGIVGLSRGILEAIARAELDPTSENVKAVAAAYAKEGQTPPPKLMAHLLRINSERYPDDTVAQSMIPWALIGGAAILFLIFRRR